jgi:SAM-dependent methyltransferase
MSPVRSRREVLEPLKRLARRSAAIRSAHGWLRESAIGRRPPEQVWTAGAPQELAFWERRLRDPDIATAWGDYEMRTDPGAPMTDPLVRSLINRIPTENISILDVGAGPLTALGKTHPGKKLSIIPVDPLASDYLRVMREVGIEPPVPTIACRGEDLLDRFQPGSFDIAYARNALDHSVDPVRVIRNMVELVKDGRFVVLRHRRQEGRGENYWGLHQWNFELEEGEFLIWRGRGDRVSIDRVLNSTATVEGFLQAEWLVCLITRRDA